MEHRAKRYKKLKIKRKPVPTKNIVNNIKLISDVHDNEENFKIKRFMKDVKKFCGQSPIEQPDYNACGDGFKIFKDTTKQKGDKLKKSGDSFNVCKDIFREKGFTKRDGLFQRGVMTKGFNKGLMPPSLNARINEDLKKVIELANRGNPKNVNKPIEDKITSLMQCNNDQASYHDISDSHQEINSPCIDIVEAEVQVDTTAENDRKKSDLYLQFTHFVTRCLFNSGIDKQEIKSYTDSIKESLIETYHNKVPGNEDSTPNSQVLNKDLANYTLKTPIQMSERVETVPLTSKSEEGLERTKFTFTTDSQLSDDVVIRRPKPFKMYASGLDYLKSVYGNSSDGSSFSKIKINSSPFSPIQQDTTYNPNLYNIGSYQSTSNICNLSKSSCRLQQPSHYSSISISSDKKNYCANYNDQDPSTSLQYFPGNKNRLNHQQRNNDFQSAKVTFKVDMNALKEPAEEESPKYISLLPPNHRVYVMNNLHSVQSLSEKTGADSDGKPIQHTLLSLPLRPPPRKSPDIQYVPRKMF